MRATVLCPTAPQAQSEEGPVEIANPSTISRKEIKKYAFFLENKKARDLPEPFSFLISNSTFQIAYPVLTGTPALLYLAINCSTSSWASESEY